MRKNPFLLANVAALFMTAFFLAGCYAPLKNQNGNLSLGVQLAGRTAPSATSAVIVLVVDSGSQDTFAEMINLIAKGKSQSGYLSPTDHDRLKTLGKQLSTSGLVDFGGFPFFETTVGGSSGSFNIQGVPAGRSYFVKLYVFQPGHTFSVQDINDSFYNLIQLENLVFNTENLGYVSDTGWQSWTPAAGQPVGVNAGQSASINVTLTTMP